MSLVEKCQLKACTASFGTAHGVVETLSVLPCARRAGVGGALMAAIKDRLGAAGLSTLELDVVATNADAIRFYERHGLRPALTRMMGRLDVGASS
jgi:ribosomal protein S18 acetylase RimI-like enzyme